MLDGNNFGIALPEFHTSGALSVSRVIARHIQKSVTVGIAHADQVHNSFFQADIFPSSILSL
jgi:hypothetical protein